MCGGGAADGRAQTLELDPCKDADWYLLTSESESLTCVQVYSRLADV